MDHNRRKTVALVLLLLILALAAAVRFYWLEAQSLWHDEGNSARIAERSIRLILEGAAGDIHPPLYYLALHYWRALLGQSEFALRSFSVMGGVGLVALTYVLGAHLGQGGRPGSDASVGTGDVPTGLAAAFLAAINPFQVYYSQEARSYIWVAFLAAAATYCGYRFLKSVLPAWRGAPGVGSRPRVPWAVGYTLAITAGLYTHYVFPIVLIPINLIAFVQLSRLRVRRPLVQWILLHLIPGLLFLPWIHIAVRQLTSWPSGGSQIPVGQALAHTFRLLSLGLTVQPVGSNIALLGFGVLLVLGLVPRLCDAEFALFLLLVLWLIIPVALLLALNLYQDAFLKFMLVVSPPFCLLVGRGVTRFLLPISSSRRPILFPLALSLGVVLSFSYESLDNLYFDPAYARGDYRGIAHHLQSVGRPGDAVILDAPNQWEVFTYYYPHVERVYPIPRSRPVDESIVVGELEQITAKHDRIFVLFWAEVESDPERIVERWLNTHAYPAADQWWSGGVRLATYGVPSTLPTSMDSRVNARLGGVVLLRGFTLLSDRLSPGEMLQITLYWEASAPIGQRYKVFLHLVNSEGALTAQRDAEPGGGMALTNAWEPGQLQIDNHGVIVPVGTMPGEYQLILGLYPLGDPAARLPVMADGEPAGDVVRLTSILVTELDSGR